VWLGVAGRGLYTTVKQTTPHPTSPDLARPHLIGAAGCGCVWLGVAGCGWVCGCGVALDLFIIFPPNEHQENIHHIQYGNIQRLVVSRTNVVAPRISLLVFLTCAINAASSATPIIPCSATCELAAGITKMDPGNQKHRKKHRQNSFRRPMCWPTVSTGRLPRPSRSQRPVQSYPCQRVCRSCSRRSQHGGSFWDRAPGGRGTGLRKGNIRASVQRGARKMW
jgi:hypothetical protein